MRVVANHGAEQRERRAGRLHRQYTIRYSMLTTLDTTKSDTGVGVSEEQICDLFSRCGPVVSFRLVYDKETGRPKGFGFLEYTDVDAAAAAVRNLNEHDIMGRTLRVDYSNDNDKGSRPAGQDTGLALPQPGVLPVAGDSSTLPPLPPGTEAPSGLPAPDAISRTMASIPAPQLLDILSQMKGLVHTDPQRAAALLQQAPQLSYAIFQALLLLGFVSTDILGSLISTTQGAAPAAAPPQPQPPPPAAYPPQMPQGFAPPPPQQFSQSAYAPQQYAPTPPQAAPYQPPPQVQQPAYGAPPSIDPQIMETVRNLTRDQILSLDENSRNEIMRIRMAMSLPAVP